jgi:hypothetical protein
LREGFWDCGQTSSKGGKINEIRDQFAKRWSMRAA